MRPRKAAMTRRPSPQLLSSQRKASLRDELYFPGFRDPLLLPRPSSCKLRPRGFLNKTWEVLSTIVGTRHRPIKSPRAAPTVASTNSRASNGASTPAPNRLPTKVDLHVHEITPTRRTTTRTRAQNPRPATFPPKTAGGTPIPIWLSQVFPQPSNPLSRFESPTRIK